MGTTDDAPRIVVVGSYNAGFTMEVPRIPVPGETVLGSEFEAGAGGKGSNQAIGAARLGADAAFVGRVGEDRYADEAIELWEREGVDAGAVERTAGTHTGAGIVVVDEDGENAIAVAPGANAELDAADVRDAAAEIERADVVLAQLEIEDEPVREAARIADESDVPFVLNPAPARELPEELIERADYLTPNETEARILDGRAPDADADEEAVADALLDRGATAVLTTLGADGALLATEDGYDRVPAPAVDPVDTTGAGDAFNAAFAVALGEGRDPVAAARFACRAGSAACTAFEVIPALPSRDGLSESG